jgi:hypothetical protein
MTSGLTSMQPAKISLACPLTDIRGGNAPKNETGRPDLAGNA